MANSTTLSGGDCKRKSFVLCFSPKKLNWFLTNQMNTWVPRVQFVRRHIPRSRANGIIQSSCLNSCRPSGFIQSSSLILIQCMPSSGHPAWIVVRRSRLNRAGCDRCCRTSVQGRTRASVERCKVCGRDGRAGDSQRFHSCRYGTGQGAEVHPKVGRPFGCSEGIGEAERIGCRGLGGVCATGELRDGELVVGIDLAVVAAWN